MAMYEISPLNGFNERGFPVQKPTIDVIPGNEAARDEQSSDTQINPLAPEIEVDQDFSESGQNI